MELIRGTPSAGFHSHFILTPRLDLPSMCFCTYIANKSPARGDPIICLCFSGNFQEKKTYTGIIVCLEFEYFADIFFCENRPKKKYLESIDYCSLLENAFHLSYQKQNTKLKIGTR